MGNDAIYRRVVNWDSLPNEVDRAGITRKSFAAGLVSYVQNIQTGDIEMGPHSHEFDQLIHVLQGGCDVFIEGEKHSLGPNDLLLVPANTEHSVVCTEKPFVNLLVNPDGFAASP